MKILIVTQKVDKDDDVLGFFHDWIAEFAKQYEKVTVVCLEMGEFELPKNVSVHSLGKEKSNFGFPACRQARRISDFGVIKRIKYLVNFYRYIWKYREDYDFVFVHMVPMYAILGAPVWRIFNKKIALWYTHGHVPLALKVSEKLVDVIFTATQESCRLGSEKVKVVGHGIDTFKFRIVDDRLQSDNFNIISVGRIAPIKDYETLIRALEIVVKNFKIRKVRLKIVGAALLDEHGQYFRKIKKMVHELGLGKYVEFTGSVSFTKIKEHLEMADMMASTSRTGSLDKVMLEAMSMELPVASCNEALQEVLPDKEKAWIYKPGDFKKLAELIASVININDEDKKKLGSVLRAVVVKNHGLENLIKKIKKSL